MSRHRKRKGHKALARRYGRADAAPAAPAPAPAAAPAAPAAVAHSRRRHRHGHTYARVAHEHGHAFAEDMRKAGGRIRKLAEDHPIATAGLVGAAAGTAAGSLGPGTGLLIGATAGLMAEETYRKK